MKMKVFKTIAVILLSAGMILVFAACGSSDGAASEEPAPEETADTGTSETSDVSDVSDVYTFDGVGFSYELPEGVTIEKGSVDKADFGEMVYGSGVRIGFPVYYDMTDEEMSAQPGQAQEAPTFVIVCVENAETADQAIEKLIAAMTDFGGKPLSQEDIDTYSSVKEIHKENGCMWLMAPRDKGTVREECQEEYDALYNATEDIINNHMKFFAPEKWEGFSEDAIISFETVDLEGNPVKSEELFAKNKVTMINLWGTYCGPCIGEMPELETLNQEFASKGGGIVGIVVDVPVGDDKYLDNAKTIIKESGVTYPNIRAWEGYDEMLEHQGTPTTFFVDSKGKLIGEPVLGAQTTTYPKVMEDLLSKAE